MIQFTPEAQRIRDEYFGQVRAYVGASKTAEPDEVLGNVTEHIEQELQDIAQPVTAEQLQVVLNKLGSPRQWVSTEDLSWWRQMTMHLRTGPEDWRLAYLSLGTLVFGTLLAGPLGILGSFCLSRAALSISDRDEIRAKKWLLYPSLLIVYFLLAIPLAFWPAFVIAGLFGALFPVGFGAEPLFDHDGLGTTLALCSTIGVGLYIWWSLLDMTIRRRPNLPKTVFKPFAECWNQRWLRRAVLIVGLTAAALAVITCLLFVLTDGI